MLANPAFLFVFIWSSLICFFSLGVLDINVSYSAEAVFTIAVNVLLAVVLFFVFPVRRSGLNFQRVEEVILGRPKSVMAYWRLLFSAYALISAADVVHSGGVPLLWKITGDPREYVDFGIPTLHGMANAIVFFLASFGVVLNRLKFPGVRLSIFSLFVWQVIILSRGTIMVLIVQMVVVQLMLTRPALGRKILFLAFFVFVVVFFGILGDLRQGGNPYYGLVVPDWKGFFEFLPSGVLWFYVYFVSGFNNFLYNSTIVDPSYFPVHTFAKLLPSVVYGFLGVEKSVDSFEFVNSGLNVSTIYSGFYSDFGVFSFVPVFFIQAIASYSYYRAQRGSVGFLLSFAVCCQAIVFSPFIDTFFYLPFIFQFALIWLLRRCVL